MGKSVGTGDILRTLADAYAHHEAAYRARQSDLERTMQTHGIADAHQNQMTIMIGEQVARLNGRAESIFEVASALIEGSGRQNKARLRRVFWDRVNLRRRIIAQNAHDEG